MFLAVAALSGCAVDGEEAYRRGLAYDYGRDGYLQDASKAEKMYRKAAEQGHAEAQYKLGQMHSVGRGARLSQIEAAKWYRAAADQGHNWARHSLAHLYEDGRGVAWDEKEATTLLLAAALDGHAGSQAHMGERFEEGRGVERDYSKALDWYRRGAEGGDIVAQVGLGSMYLSGRGAKLDTVQALKWLTIALGAAQRMNSERQYDLRKEVRKAERLLQAALPKMTDAEILEGKLLAAEWAEKHLLDAK